MRHRTARPCPHCGASLSRGDRFCRECGTPVVTSDASSWTPTVAPRPWWRRRLGLGVGALLGGCVVIVVLASVLDGDAPDPTPPGPTGQLAERQQTTETPRRAATVEPIPPTRTPESAALPAPTVPAGVPSAAVPSKVVRVVDGDTINIEVDDNDDVAPLRLIGIDTPETVHPTDPRECFGTEATRHTAGMLLNRTVWLERDVSETDQFGRLLRYVWVVPKRGGDAYLANEQLVAGGYAVASDYPPDVKYSDRLRAAERQARDAGLGLWAACRGPDTAAETPTPTPTPTPPPVTIPTPTPALAPPPPQDPRRGCEPSYPDVCIPPPPPDLDCFTPEMPYTNIRVLPPDPHGFDGRDNDGYGCEG